MFEIDFNYINLRVNWLENIKKRWISSKKSTKIILSTIGGIFLVWIIMFIAIPSKLFNDPYSTLLYSKDGELLGARIATDGQWRFPVAERTPEKFAKCITTYEDKRFFWHPGIDPLAIARAVRQNISKGGIVSGGSTLTMQVARLARENRDRNLYEKIVESIWALYFESRYSKQTILSLYASHAPFGGNVVGLETAAWRYFGRNASELSWAESATLAVLPNSPALIHPGRNREQLKDKRDRLLKELMNRGVIEPLEYELGCMEPLPDKPLPLPNIAPHLLERLAQKHQGERITCSLDKWLQIQVQNYVDSYSRVNIANYIHNMAAIVADVESGEVLAYAGNVSFEGDARHGNSVDIITSPRSTGSVLKPILYAGMMNDGLILPYTLIPDTPLNIDGFTPQNFNKTFTGAVPANRAIERSLNVPLVRMLSMYNTGRFMSLLRNLGVTTLTKSEDHYGASIILGGSEGTLWDLVGIYASMSRVLNHFEGYNSRYDQKDIHPLTPYPKEGDEKPILHAGDKRLRDRSLLSAASIWYAFEAMAELNRPEEEADWQQFSSMKRIAWKTGTSWGGRDAWAMGTTPRYAVGVWAGNASGEGRPGLTGVGTAAPLLFDIFSILPSTGWFNIPYDEVEKMAVCKRSGYKASAICDEVDTLYIPLSGVETGLCPFHKRVHLTQDERYRVNSSCEAIENMVEKSWFILPPAQEYYYRNHNTNYLPLPPFKEGCVGVTGQQIDIIYPEHNALLYLPKGFSGERERFIFRAAHANPSSKLYWYIDDNYIGETERNHTIACEATKGLHVLTLTDSYGEQRRILFEVVDAE